MIDNCLKLHGQICTPEMLVVHEGTLEKFFRKNFSEEIRRLQVDSSILEPSEAPSIRSDPTATTSSQYQNSLYEQSLNQSISTTSTSRPKQYARSHPLQLDKSRITLPPTSPISPHHDLSTAPGKSPTQTPLQRHLAYLARHGLNGVSSRPETGGSDSLSGGSPPVSMVNVAGSPTTGSMRFRWSSRLGGFNFGRS
jgi:dedicator of cytokinesis protein 3